jgi:hypothetical protein
MVFDIVIPVGPNDIKYIHEQVEYTKKNIIGYKNIFIISCKEDLYVKDCTVISENIFPFNIDTVASYHTKHKQNGWYLQQLLKLYAGFVIPDILDNYLVIDSDTYFLKPTKFIDNNNKLLYNFSNENHKEYFNHMNRLLPTLVKMDKTKSGICHHMIFNKNIIKVLFDKVEYYYNFTNNVTKKFYEIFLLCVDKDWYSGSGASEYEIYFNFIQLYFPNDYIIRELIWKNTHSINNISSDYDYVSCHHYMRV